ncbi:MAG: hypothetical protein HY927_14440 [Elusimicrobia bacterium]|nr:hypothetical protein [Elusimicrobiota bacterium]
MLAGFPTAACLILALAATAQEPPSAAETDYLKPAQTSAFLDSLKSREIQAPLENRKAFAAFLLDKKVPEETLPGFMALHQLMAKAAGPDKEALAHILPTIVRFLEDGHSVVFDTQSERYFGTSEYGHFDHPLKVTITDKALALHPLMTAEIVAHEFQHVYDQSVQRSWPMEALEARAQKASMLTFRLLKNTEPAKYRELRRGDSEETREILRDAELCLKALDEGPAAFVKAVGFGQCTSMSITTPELSRFSLKGVLDADSGEPAHLAAVLLSLEREGAAIAALGAERETLRQSMRRRWTQEVDLRLKDVEDDLSRAQTAYYDYERDAVFREVLVRRLLSEYDWLRRKDGPDAVYDLHLAVDHDFVAPPLPKPDQSPAKQAKPPR